MLAASMLIELESMLVPASACFHEFQRLTVMLCFVV
jgi:hypothetical protein